LTKEETKTKKQWA